MKRKNTAALKKRIAHIDRQLVPIRTKAASAPEVVSASWQYLAALKASIEKTDPVARGLLSIRNSLANEFVTAKKASKPAIARQVMEIENQLAPIRAKAAAQPELRAAVWQYIAVLKGEMQKTDPSATNLLSERKQLVAELGQAPRKMRGKTSAPAMKRTRLRS